MQIFYTLLGALWAVFLIVWFVSAFNTKRYAKRSFFRGFGFRFLILVIAILLFQLPGVRDIFEVLAHAGNPPLAAAGVLIAASGLAFAIWARLTIGRNWGMPMSLKEGAELVTSGPYAYVRHPIYTGVITMMLGSVLVFPAWLPILVVACGYFIWSGKAEEKIMLNEFPEAYPAYMARTKTIIPFIW
jgi:protein-S-isoprenylcysteine O-methyltransferase Ste14